MAKFEDINKNKSINDISNKSSRSINSLNILNPLKNILKSEDNIFSKKNIEKIIDNNCNYRSVNQNKELNMFELVGKNKIKSSKDDFNNSNEFTNNNKKTFFNREIEKNVLEKENDEFLKNMIKKFIESKKKKKKIINFTLII